jgi:hypothetical protein
MPEPSATEKIRITIRLPTTYHPAKHGMRNPKGTHKNPESYAESRICPKDRQSARPVFLPTSAKIAQKSVLNSAFWCFNGNLAALTLQTSNNRHYSPSSPATHPAINPSVQTLTNTQTPEQEKHEIRLHHHLRRRRCRITDIL